VYLYSNLYLLGIYRNNFTFTIGWGRFCLPKRLSGKKPVKWKSGTERGRLWQLLLKDSTIKEKPLCLKTYMINTVGCCPLYLYPGKCIKIEKSHGKTWMYLSSCFVLSSIENLADLPSPLLRLSALSDSQCSIEVPSNLPKNPFPTSTEFETRPSVSVLMWSITTSSLITRG
jgi:hypothetical protein